MKIPVGLHRTTASVSTRGPKAIDGRRAIRRMSVTHVVLLRYGFAVVGSGVGVALSALLTPDEAPIYALLVGVVAFRDLVRRHRSRAYRCRVSGGVSSCSSFARTTVFGGFETTRWAVTLAVALSVIWVSVILRLRRERATIRRIRRSRRRSATWHGLQELSATLSAAVTPSDVAQALVARTPSLIGARGAALGLIDGSDLVIVDPRVAGSTHEPGFRLPLATRAPIAQAASEGRTIVVDDRSVVRTRLPGRGGADAVRASRDRSAAAWLPGSRWEP